MCNVIYSVLLGDSKIFIIETTDRWSVSKEALKDQRQPHIFVIKETK